MEFISYLHFVYDALKLLNVVLCENYNVVEKEEGFESEVIDSGGLL